MAFGFGLLRLNSSSFWQLSLQEFHAAISHHLPKSLNPMASSALAELMHQYPDT
ncbi:MAG: phage tail assembly chaperone [Rhizobiaceae bacterium]|nr:phage tail assembly chaperone [Rhizobiaceae bacterium]